MWLKKVLLTVSVLLLLGGLGEILLRFIFPYYPVLGTPPYFFESDPQNGFTLRPNFKTEIKSPDGDFTYKINSQGIRSSNTYSKSDSQASWRIFAIGDSFTLGQGIEVEFAWPSMLQSQLRNEGFDIEVLNLGVTGYGASQSFHRMKEYFHRLNSPDMVIYMFCGNDVDDSIRQKPSVVYGIWIGAYRKHKQLAALMTHLYMRSRFLSFIMDHGYSIIGGMPWERRQNSRRVESKDEKIEESYAFLETKRWISEMVKLTQNNGIPFLVVTVDDDGYHSHLKSFLNSMNIPLLKARQLIEERGYTKEQTRTKFDGHLNELGGRLIAEGLAEKVKRLVPKSKLLSS